MIVDFILLGTLIILSALFSGTEIAMMSLTPAKVRELQKKKVKGIKTLARLKKDTHKLLITILIGNNLVNIGASVYATVLFTDLYGSSGIGIATGVMTLLVLVFGEITPKTLAHKHRIKFSLFMAKPLAFCGMIFYPFVRILDFLIKLLTDQEPEKQGNPEETVSEGELKAMIDLSLEKGAINKQEGELMVNILEFNDIEVENVMTPRVKINALEDTVTIQETLDQVAKWTHSRIPVYTKTIDTVIGIITVKSLLMYMHKGEDMQKELKDIELNKFLNVPYSSKINDLFKQFQKKNMHMAMVRDEFGGIMGLVTLEDLLEEIVGEIIDEFDIEEQWITSKGNNFIIIQGGAPTEVISNHFDKEFPGDQHDPISSVILEEIHRFPNKNETIPFDNFSVKIEKMQNNAIKLVRIQLHS